MAAAAAVGVGGNAVTRVPKDLVGLGWRPELAAGIVTNLDAIDVVEVIADDLFKAPRRQRRALRTLADQVPLWLHGVGLGLASAAPVEERRIAALARLADELRPAGVSEHLAFVRGGGVEIGHLAAPPRTDATISGAAANTTRLSRALGFAPALENIATLVAPPASPLSEAAWLTAALAAADAPFLLDLHNLYANALNFGGEPAAALAVLPLERVRVVHLSGGHWITPPPGSADPRARLLDDHVHDVPDPVFAMLALVAERAPPGLAVIIERDGRYPKFDVLLAQIARARAALAAGRQKATAFPYRAPSGLSTAAYATPGNEDAIALETSLARLLTSCDLGTSDHADPTGLQLAAASIAAKTSRRQGKEFVRSAATMQSCKGP